MDFLQWARYCLHALCKRGARDKGRKEKIDKSRSNFARKVCRKKIGMQNGLQKRAVRFLQWAR